MWPFHKKRKTPRSLPVTLHARYDAAQTTVENARHWAMADGLSADTANSPDIRKRLRDRARYEVANNSYAKGIVLTIANDTVGTGSRLQLLTGDDTANRLIENAFADWAGAIGLAEKLRTMRMAKATDGEAFALLTANPLIDSPVKLDVRLIEADRVAAPLMSLSNILNIPSEVDGIRFDAWGKPIRSIVKPGSIYPQTGSTKSLVRHRALLLCSFWNGGLLRPGRKEPVKLLLNKVFSSQRRLVCRGDLYAVRRGRQVRPMYCTYPDVRWSRVLSPG